MGFPGKSSRKNSVFDVQRTREVPDVDARPLSIIAHDALLLGPVRIQNDRGRIAHHLVFGDERCPVGEDFLVYSSRVEKIDDGPLEVLVGKPAKGGGLQDCVIERLADRDRDRDGGVSCPTGSTVSAGG